MSIIEVFLLFATGLLISVPSAMVGLGGGVLVVPALILIFQLPTENAIAVSLVAISGTTVSATLGYIKQKKVDYKLALLYDVLDVPGVAIGAYLTTLLPSKFLTGICGIFIIFISTVLVRYKKNFRSNSALDGGSNNRWKRVITDSSGKKSVYSIRNFYAPLVSSFAGGLVTGLCGLGGGTTDTTTMILLGAPSHIAVASSEFAMALTNGTGVLVHGLLGNVLIKYALPLTLGTVIGAQIGCVIAKRIRAVILRKTLPIIAFLIGLRLMYSFFMF